MPTRWLRIKLARTRFGQTIIIALACGLIGACGGDDSPSEQPPADSGADVVQTSDAGNSDAQVQGEASAADGPAVESDASPESGEPVDSGASCAEKAKNCATQFGSLFTKANGRADGILTALVRPVDQQCTAANNDHAVLQLSILGQVQRLVVSVDGVGVMSKAAPLIGAPYEEGWHTGFNLDYTVDLGVHSTDFTSVPMDQAVAFLCDHLTVGAPVSIYAYCDGTYPASAHQIHYNDKYPDGAIVVDPDSDNPTWLLFRYDNQVF